MQMKHKSLSKNRAAPKLRKLAAKRRAAPKLFKDWEALLFLDQPVINFFARPDLEFWSHAKIRWTITKDEYELIQSERHGQDFWPDYEDTDEQPIA